MWPYNQMSNLLSRLVALNSVVILLVILLAGFSVKDYACFLVNSEQIMGQDLVDMLNGFLWKVGLLAFVIAGLFHYFTVRRIVGPIKKMSIAASEIREGNIPQRIETKTSGELEKLVQNFNAMSEKLFTIQEQREEMLRDIAHELRSPLTNINGYLEALENEVIEGDPKLFGSLLEESQRITRIVELITEMNYWNNGSYFSEKKFHPLNISDILAEVITAFRLKLDNEFSEVDVHVEQAVLLGNKDGLMQVLSNILQNTLDYNTGQHLEIKGTVKDNIYTISFTHRGQFINPGKKERIFERFYRLEESRTTKAEGAGLGLAIAKSIVTAHHGKIGVDSDGTCHTFWIELPLEKAVSKEV